MIVRRCANRESKESCAKHKLIYSIINSGDGRMNDIIKTEFKEINYRGTTVNVSRDGRIIWNGKLRNHYLNHDGYPVCAIKIPNKGWRSVQVHILVAMAYIPNPDNLSEINHKDFNRQNFDIDNLEWCDHFYNVQYSKCNRPDYKGEKNPNYGNTKLSNKYKEDPEYAKEKQSRAGIKNGRCRKIKLFLNEEFIKEFNYIQECCEYIHENYSPDATPESIRGQINKSVKNGKPYKNMTFIKE